MSRLDSVEDFMGGVFSGVYGRGRVSECRLIVGSSDCINFGLGFWGLGSGLQVVLEFAISVYR